MDKNKEMMQYGISIPVIIRSASSNSEDDKVTKGEARLQVWDKRERMTRALKHLGMCWAAAVVSVLVPLLHIVLVPSFLIAGPIIAWLTSGKESVILGGKGACPECGASFAIARSENNWPISDLCTQCYKPVTIEKE